jgi:hypothetical protein
MRVHNENPVVDRITGWTGCHGSNLQKNSGIEGLRNLGIRELRDLIPEFTIPQLAILKFLNSSIP